ncbi:hypothetical protein IAE22_31260, partial [Bacillus sp. S34]|nr:hypothetical protein [Bacillus sp. S34]
EFYAARPGAYVERRTDGQRYAVVNTWQGNDVLSAAAWTAASSAVAKSILTAGLSYIARLKVPPQQAE